MTAERERCLFFDPVSGEIRFDLAYPSPDSIPESICWPMDRQRQNKRYGFKNLTLALTMRCNMACDYCWQHRSGCPDMEKGTIDRWLDFFLDREVNSPNKILYYGGEPLLRMDLIAYSAERMRKLCRERGIPPVEQHIFTNATLLTEENLDVLQRENVFLILSIDGAPEVNALHRHTAQGASLGDQIERGIERLHARGMDFGVCCTLSRADFDPEPTVGYLLERLRPSSIELNLRHDAVFVKHAEGFAGQTLDSFRRAWDLIRAYPVVNVDLRKRVAAIADRIPLQNSSSGSKNKLAVMPDGMISSFNGAVSYPELQIRPEGEWIEQFKNRWSRNVLTASKCRQCPAAYICGQGSAFSSYLQYGDFAHTPALHCEYCRTMLAYILETVRRDMLSRGAVPYGYAVTKEDVRRCFPELFRPDDA